MKIDFVKMNGAGNDFVMIDARDRIVNLNEKQVAWICDRRRGVGADGVILLEKSETSTFNMRYFNRDGKEASMCGNGARCTALLAAELGLGNRSNNGIKLEFSTRSGIVQAWVQDSEVTIAIADAVELRLNVPLKLVKGERILHLINTGVPHAVMVCEDVTALPDRLVEILGREVRNHPSLKPEGVNVDFASLGSGGTVNIRTYERGVEAETLACGTGSVATAVVFAHLELAGSPVILKTRSGDELEVEFEKEAYGARDVRLRGPAETSYYGSFEIK